MPAHYAHRIVERHFRVEDEQAALVGAQVAQDLKVSRALRAASDRRAPQAAPAPEVPAQPRAEALGTSQNWRAKLGLS